MALDPRTEELIRAAFGGRVCCQCGGPAARLVDDRFYCHDHFFRCRRSARGKGSRGAPRAAVVPAAMGSERGTVEAQPPRRSA